MEFQLRVVMPSNPRFLAVVRSAVCELGSVYGLPEEECRSITLAVDEALANIIRHAYKNNHDREIELHCSGWSDRLEFTFMDCGEPPDPGRICGQPLDEIALSGRGTHMIRMIMDEVVYQQVPGGNQLRLRKYLPGTSTAKEGGR